MMLSLTCPVPTPSVSITGFGGAVSMLNHRFGTPPRLLRGLLALFGALAVLPGVVSAQDFPAVLAAPDDADLNLAYARSAVQRGELSIAASTLERILINDPDRHSVRLFYGVVLYRLGDFQNAREQLRRLETAPLTDSQRAEATAYVRRIDGAEQPVSLSGRLAAGLSYEEDAAGAYQTAFDIVGAPAPEEGLSSEVALSIEGSRGLGADGGWEVYGSALVYDHSALSGAAIDFQRADAEAGFSRATRLTETRIGAVANHVRLQGEPQLTELGLRGDTRFRATNALTLSARFEAVDQSYDEPLIDALSPLLGGDRNGTRYLVGAGASMQIMPRTTLGGAFDYSMKSAGYEPFGYDSLRVGLNVHQRYGRGVYAAASASVRWLDYEAADAFFLSGAVREDTRTTARIAMGAPLSILADRGAGGVTDALALEVAATYASRESGPPLADFDGLGAELRLIWRFGSER